MFPYIREIFVIHYKYLLAIYSGENIFKYFTEKLSPLMKEYYPSYCKVATKTTNDISKRCGEDQAFKQFVDKFVSEYNDHNIKNYFSYVFQRVMRYQMLFDEIEEDKIGENDDEYVLFVGCKDALKCSRETSKFVNDCQEDL